MTLRPTCIGLILVLAACSTDAQTTTAPAAKQAAKGPRVVRLTFTPAPPPEPALKYLLLPSIPDQESGNAEPILYTASLLAERVRQTSGTEKLYEKVIDWVGMPVDKLPREEVGKALDASKDPLRYARLASRREWCAWDLPFRSEGINTELPALITHRLMARLLVLRARLAIADGRFKDAIDDLQTVAAIAHWLGQAPTLIHSLVGMANATVVARSLENWINQPGSPNLYWALTDLPRPLVDARRGVQYEQWWIALEFPHLRELDSMVLPEQQVRAIHDALIKLIAMNPSDPTAATAPAADQAEKWEKAVARHQQGARGQLLAAGYRRTFVDAIGPEQAVLLRLFDDYRKVRDDYFKLFVLPYWEGREGIDRIEEQLNRDMRDLKQEYGSGLFKDLMPALTRARFFVSRADRDIMILRCIEAIRLYAAGHGGKLPPTLKDIAEVPVPEDPITGQPFVYEFAGDRATLIGRVPDANSEDGVRYDLNP